MTRRPSRRLVTSPIGGAGTGRQYIEAGLVDELSIHLIPVLFGSGTRMFEQLGDAHLQFEPVSMIQTKAAIHLLMRRTGR